MNFKKNTIYIFTVIESKHKEGLPYSIIIDEAKNTHYFPNRLTVGEEISLVVKEKKQGRHHFEFPPIDRSIYKDGNQYSFTIIDYVENHKPFF